MEKFGNSVEGNRNTGMRMSSKNTGKRKEKEDEKTDVSRKGEDDE